MEMSKKRILWRSVFLAAVCAAAGGICTAEQDQDAIKSISFTMPEDGYVSLNILNDQGQLVRQLLACEPFPKGERVVAWDGASWSSHFRVNGRDYYPSTEMTGTSGDKINFRWVGNGSAAEKSRPATAGRPLAMRCVANEDGGAPGSRTGGNVCRQQSKEEAA